MSVFFTSDLHLAHTNVIKWRPFDSLDEMHDVTTERWNGVVKADDVVFLLGDAVMGQRAETLPLLDRLNGSKALVPGNHDHIHPMFPKNRDRWREAYHQQFHGIFSPESIWSLGGQWVTLCHFPRSGDHTEQERYSEWRPADDGAWLLHGHLHSHEPTSPDRPRQIDVGVDAWDFTPVSEEQLLAIMEER